MRWWQHENALLRDGADIKLIDMIYHAECIMYILREIGLSFKDARLRKSAKSKQFGRGVGETRGSVARRPI